MYPHEQKREFRTIFRTIVSATIGIWSHRMLVRRLVRREVELRFKGSLLGVAWAVLLPLIMLAIYSVVFGVIIGSRWTRPAMADPNITSPSYPVVLFSGLILFGVLSEVLTRAPSIITDNSPYVKKVVFPLEILPLVALLNAIVTALISFVLLVIFCLFEQTYPQPFSFLIPFLFLPFTIMILGLSYMISSSGVFLRDIRQIIAPFITSLMFMSPIFISTDNIPSWAKFMVFLNPISFPVISIRNLLFWDILPTSDEWLLYSALSLAVYAAGLWVFMRTKKAFADVL